jgi:transposase
VPVFGPVIPPTPEGTKLALRALARRYEALTEEIDELTAVLDELTTRTNPALRAAKGVGVDVASVLLVAAGDNPERLRSDAAFAAMCGVSPTQCPPEWWTLPSCAGFGPTSALLTG